MGRCLSETRDGFPEMLVEQFREIFERYAVVFRRILPELTREEVTMRILFMAGVMSHTIMNLDKLQIAHGDPAAIPGSEELLHQMVQFSSAGFQAGHQEEEERDAQ